MLKDLIKLATRLDSAGLYKDADVLDGIISKIAQQGMVEFSNEPMDINEPVDNSVWIKESPGKALRSEFGEIRPPGDPFTYNYDPVEDAFIVATAPDFSTKSIGQKLMVGSEGYKKLFPYVFSSGNEAFIKRLEDDIIGLAKSRGYKDGKEFLLMNSLLGSIELNDLKNHLVTAGIKRLLIDKGVPGASELVVKDVPRAGFVSPLDLSVLD